MTDAETALDATTPVIYRELGDNLTFERALNAGDPDKGFAEADAVVATTFGFGRHTGVTNEARAIVADWNSGDGRLTVYQGTQAPHMTQNLFAKHLGLEEQQVRVITKDVGGSFGIKVHIYADEMATVALAKLLRRPVKFVADRFESFITDIHARDHRVNARIGVKNDGTITAFEIDALTGIGPYSVYPRTSGIEANQVVNLVGGPYTCANYRARARVVFQNKNVMCQYRAVGHPIATAVTEGLVELAAAKIGMDPVELRRRNLFADDAYPATSAAGLKFEGLSHHASLDKILLMMDYAKLRSEQAGLRQRGVHRGIGFASFIEVTNPSAAFYGVGGARISSQDGATLRLDATGTVFCHSGVTEQGQGTELVLAQCVATSFGVPIERVRVVTGDTDNVPYGGGTWASRAAGIGGEAAWQAGRALRANVLAAAASILQADPNALDIRGGVVVDADTGRERMGLEEVARIVYFRPDTLPPGFQAEFLVTRHYVPRNWPFAFTNGVQASYLEVDIRTGEIRLLRHWCVEDCGTVINPQLVDEQIRGGIVQGIGAVLFEHCLYDDEGQLLNGTMMDYLVPMAGEMPDIDIGHVVTPTADSELGAKGAGEAGTAGAPACIMNAVNDALRPLGAGPITQMPITPEHVLGALRRTLSPNFTANSAARCGKSFSALPRAIIAMASGARKPRAVKSLTSSATTRSLQNGQSLPNRMRSFAATRDSAPIGCAPEASALSYQNDFRPAKISARERCLSRASIIGETESRQAMNGSVPPAWERMKLIEGKRSSAPENSRLTAARVVSNTYSIMKPGHGSVSDLLDGCRLG